MAEKELVGSLCFVIEGEFLTNHFRERWVESYDPDVIISLQQSLAGFTVDHADALLSGKKKLVGENTVDFVDDECYEVCGKPLLSIDQAKAFRKGNEDMHGLMTKMLASFIMITHRNVKTCRVENVRHEYLDYLDLLEGHKHDMLGKIPSDFAKMALLVPDTKGFLTFIGQLVIQYRDPIKKIGLQHQIDYYKDYECTYQACMEAADEPVDDRVSLIKARAAILRQGYKEVITEDGIDRVPWEEEDEEEDDSRRRFGLPEDVPEVIGLPEISSNTGMIGMLANSTMSRLSALGLTNANKYRDAMNKNLVDPLTEIVEADPAKYNEVQYGYLSTKGKLYVCGFFEHNTLEHLLREAGLWVENKMLSLKDGPAFGAGPVPKAWFAETSIHYKGKTGANKTQKKVIKAWCEANNEDYEKAVEYL